MSEIARETARLRKARRDLGADMKAHRQAFRAALRDLFSDYGYTLTPDPVVDGGLQIVELSEHGISLAEIPE